ncbi:phosphopantetheine-binding protein [Streptomyces sp. NPDC047968]|uniref:phosphopantetheine-binding protein n=1 Tax=unclassified Streptomyces TaxID=2593676 RepID=UPI00344198A0
MEDVVATVIALLSELQDLPEDEVRAVLEEAGQELPVDSLLIVEVLTRVEERYSVSIPADRQAAEATRSVRAFAGAVLEAVTERQHTS